MCVCVLRGWGRAQRSQGIKSETAKWDSEQVSVVDFCEFNYISYLMVTRN